MTTVTVLPGQTQTITTADTYDIVGQNNGGSGTGTVIVDGAAVLVNQISTNGVPFVIQLENSATMTFNGTGPGIGGSAVEFHINGSSTLDWTAGAGGSNLEGRTIYFGTGEDDGNGTLRLPSSQYGPSVTIEGFSDGDQIDLGGTPDDFNVEQTARGVTITVNYPEGDGHVSRTIIINGDYDPGNFGLDADGDLVYCFLAGTLIATPHGDVAVETLAIGDLVMTANDDTRPVLWVGRRTVVPLFADPLRSYPVRIGAGALAENVPWRDLYVSPDHGLLVDGVLVQAGALVNGTTITRVESPEARFAYYHIELADHSLVLAEGAPAETFVDNVTRRRFDNYGEYEARFGRRPAHIPELALPRVKSARQLPRAVRERLAARARALGVEGAAAA